MTTKRTFFCNVCGDQIGGDLPIINKDGIGFDFKSGNKEFSEGKTLWKYENHLCLDCINAIYDVSRRLYAEKKLLDA